MYFYNQDEFIEHVIQAKGYAFISQITKFYETYNNLLFEQIVITNDNVNSFDIDALEECYEMSTDSINEFILIQKIKFYIERHYTEEDMRRSEDYF